MTLAAVALAGGRGTLAAQTAEIVDSFPHIVSMGLPHAYRPYGGLGTGFTRKDGGTAFFRGMLGLHRDLGNPIQGFVGFAAEAWLETRRSEIDGGARLMYAMSATGTQIGLDYSARLNRIDLALTLFLPLRRGGLVVPGGGLRLDWVPARSAVTASLAFPLFQPYAGKTRPRSVEVQPVTVPAGDLNGELPADSTIRLALTRMHHSALWITRFTVPYFPRRAPETSLPQDSMLADHIELRDLRFPEGHTVAAEVEGYHAELTSAFAVAAMGAGHEGGPSTGLEIADAARRVLLDELLIPYDRDFGQTRRAPVLAALRRRASHAFLAWLDGSRLVPPGQRQAVIGVYHALLETVQAAADTIEGRWVDTRLSWLPLQLALLPEQHDTQSEIDDLLERIMGQSFQRGHDLTIATDEAFVGALNNSILDARDYHVLWIHDFRGRNDENTPDELAQRTVLDAYFRALINAARRFDVDRKVPTFLIFLDQYYYKAGLAERWLELLQDPLGFDFRLKDQFRDVELAVEAAQDSLRAAVAASPALQEETARRGKDWLRRLFAVHISITNPPDPSFRSPGIKGILPPGTSDDVMRDHRKIAFSDLTERDPSRGVAILTGLGVGEHYAHGAWIDRTIVIRGPAAVTLKAQARDLLLSQGFTDDQIPMELRPADREPDFDHRVEILEVDSGWTARTAIVMNVTGYGPKSATAAKAALYTLMPAGSLIWIADPQWLNRLWGGMLLGSALRGVRVMLVGPGPENTAFGGAFIQMSLQRELFLRLTQAREVLAQSMEQSGGSLQVGLWKTRLGAHDVRAGLLAMLDGMDRYPFILDVLAFHPSVQEMFEYYGDLVEENEISDRCPADGTIDYHPKFHLKMQFFGTREALREAVGAPGWTTFFDNRIRERLLECRTGTDIELSMLQPIVPYLESRSPEERERQASYLIVGSHNMDLRSFFLDGEAIGIVAGAGALLSVGDLLVLSTVGVEWVTGPEDIDENFPHVGNTKAAAARALEAVF
ncbi:MAG: hypothetical protein O7E49_06870 [Gemmatimonadetes bacterium]|nr:hypothetical protein [Gemmatimonadota bacterium]